MGYDLLLIGNDSFKKVISHFITISYLGEKHSIMDRYKGIPILMLKGKVMASAIGKKIPSLAFGTASLIAAGTAIYEALAASTVNNNLFPILSVK